VAAEATMVPIFKDMFTLCNELVISLLFKQFVSITLPQYTIKHGHQTASHFVREVNI
jgi:hypothetical protein